MTGYHSNYKQNFKVDKNHNLFYILTRVNKIMFTCKEGKCLRLYEFINGDLNNNNSLN